MRRSCAPAFFGVRPLSGVGRRAAVVALGALAISFGTTAPASADSCSPVLTDGLGLRWDITSSALDPVIWGGAFAGGWIDDGSSDSYDGWGVLRIGSLGTPYFPDDLSSPISPANCTTENGGRELSFPSKVIDGLDVKRKIYVPSSGVAFARYLDIVHNPGSGSATTSVVYEGDLGSDGDTQVLATSDGNSTVSAATDRWATSNENPIDPGFPSVLSLAHVWDGPGSPPYRADGVYGSTSGTTAWGNGQARVRYVYNVSIPAGETYTFMHFEVQRSTSAEALTAAETLGNVTTGDGFAGLDGTELAQLKNWNPNDLDGDGRVSGSDNCQFVSNADQANLDSDSLGDACDDDIDGDGLSNSVEAALGTNPNVVDTDGDGFRDAADGCPLQPGPANGCPAPSQAARDTSPPGLRIVVPQSLKRKSFVRGLTAIVTLNEAASLNFELIGPAGRTRARRSLGRTLTSQSLPVSGAGTRAVRLRPSPRLLGRARRFTASLRVTAVDRSGNKTVETRTIRVR